MKQIEQFSDIILHFLRFLAESSGVAKLELFQPFPHCKWGFSRCTDSARLRQDSAAKGIKTGTKLWYFFFSVQRLHGFRQVVQHALWHCKSINFQINTQGRLLIEGHKRELVKDPYIVQ